MTHLPTGYHEDHMLYLERQVIPKRVRPCHNVFMKDEWIEILGWAFIVLLCAIMISVWFYVMDKVGFLGGIPEAYIN